LSCEKCKTERAFSKREDIQHCTELKLKIFLLTQGFQGLPLFLNDSAHYNPVWRLCFPSH